MCSRLIADGACSGHVDGTLSPLKRCAGASCPCVFGDSLSQELFVGRAGLEPGPEDYEDFRP